MRWDIRPWAILLLTMSLLMPACSDEGGEGTEADEKADNEFLVSGHIRGYGGKKLVLEQVLDGRELLAIDSVETDQSGAFRFKAKAVGEDDLFRIRLDNQNGFAFFPGNAHTTVETRLENGRFVNLDVKGNLRTNLYNEMTTTSQNLRNVYIQEKRRMSGLSQDRDFEKWRAQEAKVDQAAMAFRAYLREFTDTTSIPIIRYFAARNLNVEANHHYLLGVAKRLSEELPGNQQIFDFASGLESFGFGRVGARPPDYAVQALDNSQIKPSDFRGKVVVLYFWASYCEFSRAENKIWSRVVREHPDLPFVILTHSIDLDPNAWRAAIAEDQLDWPQHTIGMQGWDHPLVMHYNVPTIPTTFLMDHRGIVRTINVRAAEFEENLEAILKEHGPPAGEK